MRIIRIYYHGCAVNGAFDAMNGKQCCDERGVLSGERGILRVNKFDNIRVCAYYIHIT